MPLRYTCAFCQRIANGEYGQEDDHVVIFPPRDSNLPGHLMVVPKIHVARFDSLPHITGQAMTSAARLIPHLYTDYNVIVNAGPAAGQTVFHLHIHILPRQYGDTVTMPWPDKRPSEPESL